MNEVYEIIKQIEDTTKRKEKEAILESVKGTDIENLFKKVLFLTYDPTIDFYIKEFDDNQTFHDAAPLGQTLNDLENIIAKRVFTGNMAKQWIENNYGMLSEENADIFKRVIRRDLRCGISAKTINKIWPELIYDHPYMRASSFSEKNLKNISFPCFSQTKMDGLYCDIMVFEDKVEYRSRNGSYLPYNQKERDEYLIASYPNQVLQGEALSLQEDCQTLMERSASNGYANSNDVEPERIRLYVWDMISMEDFKAKKCSIPYEKRWNTLVEVVEDRADWLRLVDCMGCHDAEDVLNHFRAKRLEGEEGTIIKDLSMIWKPGTSKHQIKVKVAFDCDLKLVGWRYGEGKYENMLGSIQCESSCGKIQVSIGTGFKDVDREQMVHFLDQWVEEEKIVKVKSNDIITNQNDPDKLSLFLPRFLEFRGDKSEADSLERVQEQVQAFTDTLQIIHE